MNGPMTIFHVTPKANLESIKANGLDPQRAKGKRKSVWGVTKGRVAWAVLHVLGKPWNRDVTLADLVVIRITLPRAAFRRYQTATWFTKEAIGTIAVTDEMILDPATFGRVGA